MKSLDQQLIKFTNEPVALLVLIGTLVWTALVGYSLDWNITNLKNEKAKLAISEAKSNWNKDQAFRQWASKHGGVYVPPTESTPASPYLSHLKNRDIVTTEGMRLTLMNPAYMLRQITSDYEDVYGVKGKITGKITFDPTNKPDSWERMALERFEQEWVDEVIEQTNINGKPYMRFMKPMYMTEGCDKCHGILGFKEGDLRGGVSVSIPMTPYLEAAKETSDSMVITHVAVWFAGITGIFAFGLYARHRQAERLGLLASLEHGALYDALTSLPNRFLFSDRLRVSMARQARNRNYQYAVCFVDLDRFKNLNDCYGHSVGDLLLKEVAERFRRILRPADTVARMGGDEFTFLVDDIGNPQEAILIANRLLESINLPFELRGTSLKISASIGICYGESHYQAVDEIIRDADIAMYRAKNLGKGRIDIFAPEMHAEVAKTTHIEHDLHTVLDRDELDIHYQPIVNLESGMIDGFEALLRWQHPDFGRIPPDEFIPIAESSDVIHRLGEWVLERACRQVGEWSAEFAGERDFFVSVNFSARQVSHMEIIDVVKETLANAGFNPARLHCEVTETLLIADQDTTRINMARLSELGVQLSADDFGTGYSSLTYLQNFNFNAMKIDKKFVQDMGPDGKGTQLVSSLLRLASDFDLQVIAEGVETREQLDYLRMQGCHWVQGYYTCPPLAADAITQLLQAGAQSQLDILLRLNPFSATGSAASVPEGAYPTDPTFVTSW
jgi:diguanylate cyclase (GGDEF)-like protein